MKTMERVKNTKEQCMVNWMEKDRKDFTTEDFIEAIVYDLHQINVYSEQAMKLLNELFERVYDK